MITILVCDRMVTILFDLGFTYYYVLVNFFLKDCDMLNVPIHVYTLVGESIVVTYFYYAYSILFMGFQTWVDLVILA